MKKEIPTKTENPKGLHQRYYISKVGYTHDGKQFELECDAGSEYFVMRLDEGGSDLKHIAACRIGVHAYADAIESHLPELAKDLRERYPLLNSERNPERSVATMLNSSTDADNINTSSISKEQKDVEALAHEFASIPNDDDCYHLLKEGFIEGYRSAQKEINQ
jgi:hypothetical protein